MGSSFAQIVDQHLVFARIQIDHLRRAGTNLEKKAYKQSAGLHLVESLSAYLHELDLNGVDVIGRYASLSAVFDDLCKKFESRDRVDFRISEILELKGKKDSWLNTLIEFQASMRRPQQLQPNSTHDIPTNNSEPGITSSREGLIATSTLNPIEKPLWLFDVASESAEKQLTMLAEQMTSLIRRHREFASEY